MRSAYERGFDVVTLKDCTATLSQEAQDMALTQGTSAMGCPFHCMACDRNGNSMNARQLCLSMLIATNTSPQVIYLG
jgi:hypothetical protein